MKKITLIILIIIAAMINVSVTMSLAQEKKGKILYYRNPMNGSITSKVPMKDDMGMDYIAVYETEVTPAPAAGKPITATVSLSSAEVLRAQVGSIMVMNRNLVKEIRTFGRIAYDPDLVVAQQEYLSIAETGQDPELKKMAKNKLKLMGMSDGQIDELEQAERVQENLILPGHSAWVYADVYQEDAPLIKVGDKIDVFTEAVPNEIFSGFIKAIDPVLNEMTRSVKIRAEIANHEFKLKPGMYVNAVINIDFGEKLAVPKEAVLDTGIRKVVWIDKGAGKYERRDVEIGAEANATGGDRLQKYYSILKGLSNGDKVVTRANFLIDSQSIINGAGVGSAYSGTITGETKKEKQTTESMPSGHIH